MGSVLMGGLYSCVFHPEDTSRGLLAEQALQTEFSLIRIPHGAARFDVRHSHKGDTQAYVGASFHSPMKWPELRHYYNEELGQMGWRFQADEKLVEIYGDEGGRTAVYCKGPYQAHLQHAGEQAGNGWDYALEFTWSPAPCLGPDRIAR